LICLVLVQFGTVVLQKKIEDVGNTCGGIAIIGIELNSKKRGKTT
jgi:hypothetical protein